jgi:hypothetical protein
MVCRSAISPKSFARRGILPFDEGIFRFNLARAAGAHILPA